MNLIVLNFSLVPFQFQDLIQVSLPQSPQCPLEFLKTAIVFNELNNSRNPGQYSAGNPEIWVCEMHCIFYGDAAIMGSWRGGGGGEGGDHKC